MADLYLVYIPKRYNDKLDYPITETIKTYMTRLRSGKDTTIISCPGYISKKKPALSSFAASFVKTINGCTRFGSFCGYKSSSFVDDFCKEITKGAINRLQINAKKKDDHRKMLFFIEENGISNEFVLNDATKESYLTRSNVTAVLIGSSNQSYNTYYAPHNNKGECDLLMYISNNEDTTDEETTMNMWEGAAVVSKALRCKEPPEELLNNMLKEVFDNYLI